jgi:SAM-dependent methyltransferase
VSESLYLHGTEPGEQARLSILNDLLNDAALRELRLAGGERILDIGSGLGQLTRAMARQAGVRAVGVERSTEQLAEARRQAERAGEAELVDFRAGDALALPLRDDEWGTFDVAHTRFLLEHVPRPLEVVRAMAKAVRPGGRIILQDDSHDILRLVPEPPGVMALWQAYIRSYDRAGNDPLVGHRLVLLLHQAGCVPVRNTWLFFGACAGQAELFRAYVENLAVILIGVREFLIVESLIDAPSFDAAIESLRRWGELPDAAFWYAVSWAEGRRPE